MAIAKRRTKTGHTSNGRGTLLIERSFGGIAIRRASGAKSKDELAEIIRILEALAQMGRLDLIRRAYEGKIKAIDVLNRSRAGLAIDIPNLGPNAISWLGDVGPKWLKGRKSASDLHRRTLRQHLSLLPKRRPNITLDELPAELVTLRQEYETVEHAVTFNNIRTSMLDPARWVEGGKRSQLWEELKAVQKLKLSASRKRPHAPFTPEKAWQLIAYLNTLRAGAGDVLWALCSTGMRPSEYWGKKWTVFPLQYQLPIKGTKSHAAVRVVPLVGTGPVPPVLSYGRYSKFFRESIRALEPASAESEPLPWTLYDCRRAFAVWMEEAGIARTRQRPYLGHAKADVTDLYEERNSGALKAALISDSIVSRCIFRLVT